jgi:hypothetical protein
MHNDAIADLLRPRAATGEQKDELSPGDLYVPRHADESPRTRIGPAIGDPPIRRS